MPSNKSQNRKARKQQRIAKFLAKLPLLPDDVIAPDPESAAMLGISAELAIRWLILLIVLACDPTAIALTVAASKR